MSTSLIMSMSFRMSLTLSLRLIDLANRYQHSKTCNALDPVLPYSSEAMSSRVSKYMSAVRLERHVLNSSDPLLEGGRARPGQLRLSGEKPGTAVYFTFITIFIVECRKKCLFLLEGLMHHFLVTKFFFGEIARKDTGGCIPVTGASMSIIVFSDLRRVAPSLMMRSAAASSIRPSAMKCCLRTSGRGRPPLLSNTSEAVSLCDGGKGTSEKEEREFYCIFHFLEIWKFFGKFGNFFWNCSKVFFYYQIIHNSTLQERSKTSKSVE
ncbi:unnamed protein product [Nesidiocoris tenuis]|uniref:Uncharacterized protein n=1 Tax=Nesidiocoris tenuis TaxID=355587 RepID=A0A6H5GCH5_9HEMI|nr:unnamed protein product [Nesidiocoris tenuis]